MKSGHWRLRSRLGFAGVFCFVLALGLQSACAENGTADAPSHSAAQATQTAQASSGATLSDSSIRLGPGDLVEVGLYGVPDFATKTRITNDGDVDLPLINYVHVGGLTVRESQALIARRLTTGGFVKDPHVSIFVDEYASQGANVLGEVVHPGTYAVFGERNLLDLISAAGGLTDRAGGSVSITHRDHPDQPLTVPLQSNRIAASDDIQILPGDTVVVRKADIVYVVGDVQHPSGLMMNAGNLTVLQAIAMAGGTTGTSKLNDVRILRKGPDGVTEKHVDLKKILQAKQPDVAMQADDILFVPSSSRKVLGSRSFDAIIQTASALSIVAVRP